MSRGRLGAWGLFAGLLGLALAAGLAVGARGDVDSPVLASANAGPHGARVLVEWLRATGHAVEVVTSATPLPPDTATVVIPAPTAARYEPAEAEALLAFARGGGTVVLLLPREQRQRALEQAFGLGLGEALPPGGDLVDDPAGAQVAFVAGAPLSEGQAHLRLGAGAPLKPEDAAWEAVTTPGALWRRRVGGGEVWAAAGPDLAQNQRLELDGNADLWARLAARGPLRFDESHHRHGAPLPLPAHLAAVLLQLLFVAAVLVAARGQRLGPPRTALAGQHRSALEYVAAVATMTRNAQVEPQVVEELKATLRATLCERLGLRADLPTAELVRAASSQLDLQPSVLTGLFEGTRLLPVSRATALVEGRLAGRKET